MGRKASGLNYRGAGGYWRQDDRTGFAVRAWNTEEQWDSLIVDRKVWEPRQPQDFVRGVKDDQTVRKPRPDAPPIWDGPLYTTTSANCVIGANFIPLTSSAGLSIGDNIGIMLDNGIMFNTQISSGSLELESGGNLLLEDGGGILLLEGGITSTGVSITGLLPYTVASGNSVVDYRAIL